MCFDSHHYSHLAQHPLSFRAARVLFRASAFIWPAGSPWHERPLFFSLSFSLFVIFPVASRTSSYRFPTPVIEPGLCMYLRPFPVLPRSRSRNLVHSLGMLIKTLLLLLLLLPLLSPLLSRLERVPHEKSCYRGWLAAFPICKSECILGVS